MKNPTLILLCFLLSSYAFSQCNSAYSQASYALAHTKKSLSSDNFDHQKYYAGRAIDALNKTKSLVESCGCKEAVSPILDALDNLTQAEDPVDWEAGRFYAKHGYEHLQTLMNKMDVCTSSGSSINYAVETPNTNSKNTNTPPTSTPSVSSTVKTDNSLQSQQEQLELEKQKLIEQQRLLEEKIQRQKQLAEEARINRQLELEEQLKLKHLAEQALFEMENNFKELTSLLSCKNTSAILQGGYAREDNVLNNESLAETRSYYLNLTLETQQKIQDALKNCSSK
ncbi:hypothetical protein JM658_09725 [Joostella atrarenae]|uniref:Uncharacterized protein n=1 Tax=Joostella atrarenae TaxID=679257 RepID=A0ABS9J3U9_9FLAO|nr:hypothetical protein [Joostella atrarenae]MCF8715102.1 hypothetical protein [Joostella atrarenae]